MDVCDDLVSIPCRLQASKAEIDIEATLMYDGCRKHLDAFVITVCGIITPIRIWAFFQE